MKRFYACFITMLIAAFLFQVNIFASETNAAIRQENNNEASENTSSDNLDNDDAIQESPAADFEYSIVQAEYVLITKYIGSASEIRIPAVIDDLPVKRLGDNVFYDVRNSLERVILPDGIISIGESAFSYCKKITQIDLPDSLTSIGESAFSWCKGLTSIVLPDSVTSLGSYVFSGCSALTQVTLSESLTVIPSDTFYGCTGLTEITLPDSVTSIGMLAFYECTGLTKITLSDSLNIISISAFSGCSGLTQITLPDSLTGLGTGAFSGCTGLTSIVIPDKVDEIHESTFKNCYALTEVTLPKGVTQIGTSAFEACYSLTSIKLPDGLKKIGNYAFKSCSSLSYLSLPSTLTSIGEKAFIECTALSFIVRPGTVGEKYVMQNNLSYICNPFTDVNDEAFYFDSVMWAVKNNITNGMTATLFGTGYTCTREQIVTFLWNYAGKPKPQSSSCSFKDVNSGGYYYNAMLWSSENGYVAGYNADTFGVGDACTREQIVMILWKYMGSPVPSSSDCTFTDCDEGGYYYKAMLWAVENNIVSGYSADIFGVGDSCTREQIVTFLYRMNANL